MAVTGKAFGKLGLHLAKADIDVDSDTWKMLLTTSGYTPDIDAHEFRSSVTNEVVGTGYTAGGMALGSLAVSYDAANDRTIVTANDLIWTGATFTARRGIVYKVVGSAATDILICHIDFGADKSPSAEDFPVRLAGSSGGAGGTLLRLPV